jgi:hypothetical protein
MRKDFLLIGRRSSFRAKNMPRIGIGAWWDAGALWEGIRRGFSSAGVLCDVEDPAA